MSKHKNCGVQTGYALHQNGNVIPTVAVDITHHHNIASAGRRPQLFGIAFEVCHDQVESLVVSPGVNSVQVDLVVLR